MDFFDNKIGDFVDLEEDTFIQNVFEGVPNDLIEEFSKKSGLVKEMVERIFFLPIHFMCLGFEIRHEDFPSPSPIYLTQDDVKEINNDLSEMTFNHLINKLRRPTFCNNKELPLYEKINEEYSFYKVKMDELRENNDYLTIGLNREPQMVLRWLWDNNLKLNDDDFREVFRYGYVNMDFSYNSQRFVCRLLRFRKEIKKGFNYSSLMTKKERKVFNSLPDKVKVYRGISSYGMVDGKGINKDFYGISWTTKKDVGIWFGKRWDTDGGLLLSSYVDKENIFCFLNPSSECECIIDPIGMNDIKVESLDHINKKDFLKSWSWDNKLKMVS